MNIVYETHFGSKLYGTNTPESDTDIKGIFIPSLQDVLLKKDLDHLNHSTGDKHSKNTKDDVDREYWSLYKFLNLLEKGETGAIDLLFSMFREDTIVSKNDEFVEWFKEHAHQFMTKNSKAFVGYCYGQAQRYGLKGSRFGDLIKLKELMEDYEHTCHYETEFKRFEDFVFMYNQLFDLKYIQRITIRDLEYLSVLGKNYQLTAPYDIVKNSIMNQYNSYGERSKKANAEDGVDWKAMSHAVRVINELEEILTTGHLKFPLASADSLKEIKAGKVPLDDCLDLISEKLESLQARIDQSNLPEKVDETLIAECILKCVK